MRSEAIIIEEDDIAGEKLRQILLESIRKDARKVLLIPPDISRAHSGGGIITKIYYELYSQAGAAVDILPALGTHFPMTRAEQLSFFGEIPEESFLIHRWRDGVTTLGEIPLAFVKEASEGLYDRAIPVEVSNYLLDPSYDLIISIGQVVPHEVAGMANYTKNIVVGCGGSQFINASHMIGAFYGIERILGKVDTPVRRLFDYAEEKSLNALPLEYVLTVTDLGKIIGLYIGGSGGFSCGRKLFEQAAALSAKRNITYVEQAISNCLVYLDEAEFHSTWIGNKAVYRTRKAIADGGNLLVLAPGVKAFGEDPENDRIIRKYGYTGRERILELCKSEAELQNNLSAAAHLIHGSTDGRFTVTYAAPLLGREAVESVGYQYMDWDEALKLYNPEKMRLGYNSDTYFISNPALGLWDVRPDSTGYKL